MPDSGEIQRRKRELADKALIAEGAIRGAQEVYEALEKSGIPEPVMHEVLTTVNSVISGLFADSSQAWAREREYAQDAGRHQEQAE